MPNTRADLERLKHRLETEIYLEPYIAELLALAEWTIRQWDNLHAELIERCETMERMASDTPVWLIVFLDGPGRGPEVAQAIHFSADETVIYGTDPEGSNDDRPRACLRCGWTGPGHKLRAHLATCE